MNLSKNEPDESIREAFDRFSEITDTCIALGREFTMYEMNTRFLNGLTNESVWKMKVVAIKESRDLTITDPKSIVHSLIIFEGEKIKAGKISYKAKGLALQATDASHTSPSSVSTTQNSESEETEEDKEFAHLLEITIDIRTLKECNRQTKQISQGI